MSILDKGRRLLGALSNDPVGFARLTAGLLRARRVLNGAELGKGVRVLGPLLYRSSGRARFGERVMFLAGMLSTELRVHPGAELSVGDFSQFNYGASVECHHRIDIGKRCMFASMVRICDREGDRVAPIFIGDDVWVAHGAIIQPGVRIGEGSVIGAGSVVVQDVPPRSLAIGNPARSMSQALASRD